MTVEIVLRILDISVADVAKRAGVSRQTAYRNLREGRGPADYHARELIRRTLLSPDAIARLTEVRDCLSSFLE